MSFNTIVNEPERRVFECRSYKDIVYTGDVGWYMILVGGHPKGHDIPFHPSTKSGKTLRTMLAEMGRDPVIVDLWANEEQEKAGTIKSDYYRLFAGCFEVGGRVVCLGRHVYDCVHKMFEGSHYQPLLECLPHPAARREEDLTRLRQGLESYPSHWCVVPAGDRAYAHGVRRVR